MEVSLSLCAVLVIHLKSKVLFYYGRSPGAVCQEDNNRIKTEKLGKLVAMKA